MKDKRILYVTDLDGTLLGNDSRVSQESASILKRMSQQGCLISVATARTPATAEPLLHGCGLWLPAVVFTGAAMWDFAKRRYIDARLLEEPAARTIIEVCHRHDVGTLRYTLVDDRMIHAFYTGKDGAAPSARERSFMEERHGLELKRFYVNDPRGLTEGWEHTVMVFAIGEADAVNAAACELRERGGCSVSNYPDIFDSNAALLEVFATGVSKASAVLRLKEMVGADSLTVFGDNLNDLPMMEVADRSVAVANALEPVREAADVVIGSNSADSVARFIASEQGA